MNKKALTISAALLGVLSVAGPLAWSQEAPAGVERESADTAEAQAVPPEAPVRRLDVLEYRIEGNTVLDPLDIETAVMPFLGPQRTVKDIEQARAALEQAYRKKGYETVGVDIPEQDVRSGIVRFRARELSVGRLRVTGSRYYSPESIKSRVPSLREGVVPRYDQLALDIDRINRSRDRTITPTLRAGLEPGTVEVDLQVEDQLPLHATFEVNDRYSSRTQRLRAVASLSYTNLFQRDHNLSLQAQVTPEDLSESRLFSASYLAPIAGTRHNLVVYGVHSESDIAAVSDINVIGNGVVLGFRDAITLPGSSRFVHSITLGFDYKDFEEDLILGSDSAATPINYVPLTAEYSLTGIDDRGITEANASLSFGIRGLGSDTQEFAFKRFGARPNFLYLRAGASRTQYLPRDFRLEGSFSGQWSKEPLISNEQFGIGGVDTVRGYFESQALGDRGLQASLQLYTPSLHRFLGTAVNDLRFFLFGDWGRVKIIDPLPGADGVITERIELASAGTGMQLRVLERFNALLTVADPLKDSESLDLDIDDRYRVHFRLWTEF